MLFTMMELIFVIVIIGIWQALQFLVFAATRDDATFVRAKSQVAAIRSGIALQRSRLMLEGGNVANIPLDSGGNSLFYFNDGNAS